MQTTIEDITERLKTAPQEALDRFMGYLDAILYEESAMYDVPEWQKEEAIRRLKEYKENPETALDYDKVMEELEKKYNG